MRKYRSMMTSMNYPAIESLYKAVKVISETIQNKAKLPQQPIYTFNPNQATINNSVLVSEVYLENNNGVEYPSWNKCIVGSNISFGVVAPDKDKAIFILCEMNEIKDIPDLLLVGSGTHALLLLAVLGNKVSAALPLPRTL